MTELNPSNIFQQRLLQYIQDYHQYKLEDDESDTFDFIVLRSETAMKEYKIAADAGMNTLECEEAAFGTLFVDLHFSPITYLIEVYVDLFGIELEKSEACQIYKNPAVRKIFDKYGQDIEGDPKEELLIEELIPFMKQFRIEHSIY